MACAKCGYGKEVYKDGKWHCMKCDPVNVPGNRYLERIWGVFRNSPEYRSEPASVGVRLPQRGSREE